MSKLIISCMVMVFSTVTQASELKSKSGFHVLDLDYFDMKGARFGYNRDPLTPDIEGHQYIGRIETDFQLRILEVGYWKNSVHTEGTAGQLQTVGWHYELGLRLTPYLSPFYEHHSRHRMDSTIPDYNQDGRPDKFPVEDSYGIRLHFYINDRPHRSLFK